MQPSLPGRVDEILQTALAEGASPGAAVAIGRHGRLVVLRGYGRLDTRPGFAPVTDSSIYDLASLTKVIGTTTAVMMLVDEGKVDLDARVSKYIPEWQGSSEKEKVTVRDLLVHDAGLPAFGPLYLDSRGKAAFLERIAAAPLEYTPRTKMVYSDYGAIMLGFIVERVSDQSIDRFLQQRVFGPLGMRDTDLGSEEDWREAMVASGYAWSEKSGSVVDMTHPADLTWAYAAGDMMSDADDLLRWSSSLVSGRSPVALALEDFTANAVATGLPDALVEYGNGMGGFSLAGRRLWGHGGFIHGYITLSVVDPATQMSVVVLASLAGRQGTQFDSLKSAITTLVAVALEAR
jgi:CubicO group peptidase (beta-lactamase class C family)